VTQQVVLESQECRGDEKQAIKYFKKGGEMNRLPLLKTEYLVTRKCELRCKYCGIIKNGPAKELTIDEHKRAIDIMKKIGVGMVVLFGGEPTTLGDGLIELIKHCKEIDMYYAIISNGVRVLKDESFFEKLVKIPVTNWTSSVDSLVENMIDKYTGTKSKSGYQVLQKFKKAGVKDLVANIVVTKKNILEMPSMIKKLTAEGIWSIVAVLQVDKGGCYSKGDPNDLPSQEEIIRIGKELAEMARTGNYLIHNPAEYFDGWERYHLKQDWYCSNKYCLTMDSDGTLLRCVDWPGDLAEFKIFDLEDPNKLEEYFYRVQHPRFICKGCFWDAQWGIEWVGRNRPEELGKDIFKHKVNPGAVK
jgi:MoaA/NifB/PqqE/SkfB family radical SAM enzyme